jgi:hypothetical protein
VDNLVEPAKKFRTILLRSNWQNFFKLDGKFDFKEIFSQIHCQAEYRGRLSVIL